MNLTFKYTGGPFGDCTSNYDVTFTKGMTLNDLLKWIIRNKPEEHGYIYTNLGWNGKIEYRYGKIIDIPKITKPSLNKKIVKICANGGWTCMGYDVDLK